MSSLADEFRARAKQQAEASKVLFEEPDYAENAKKQSLSIIGQVNSSMLSALADMLDALSPKQTLHPIQSIAQRNQATRAAATKGFSTGNYDDFDRIAAGSQPAE